jgi:hypothetical protein
MTSKSAVLARFRDRVAAACAPLGVTPSDVAVTGSGLALPSIGLSVSVATNDGKRVWRATQVTRVRQLGSDAEQEYRSVLFEEPFEREWAVARRLAMRLAETRVDAAIDAAA